MKQFCYLFRYSLIISSCIFSITLRRGKVTALWFDILIRSPLLWLFLKNCFRLNKINSRWIAVLLQAYKWTPTQGLLGISCHKKNKGFGGWIWRRFLPSLSHLQPNPFAAPSPRPSTCLPTNCTLVEVLTHPLLPFYVDAVDEFLHIIWGVMISVWTLSIFPL